MSCCFLFTYCSTVSFIHYVLPRAITLVRCQSKIQLISLLFCCELGSQRKRTYLFPMQNATTSRNRPHRLRRSFVLCFRLTGYGMKTSFKTNKLESTSAEGSGLNCAMKHLRIKPTKPEEKR